MHLQVINARYFSGNVEPNLFLGNVSDYITNPRILAVALNINPNRIDGFRIKPDKSIECRIKGGVAYPLFSNYTSLTYLIDTGKNLKEINNNSFSGLVNLHTLDIKGLTSLGGGGLPKISNTKITILDLPEVINLTGNSSIFNNLLLETILVPKGVNFGSNHGVFINSPNVKLFDIRSVGKIPISENYRNEGQISNVGLRGEVTVKIHYSMKTSSPDNHLDLIFRELYYERDAIIELYDDNGNYIENLSYPHNVVMKGYGNLINNKKTLREQIPSFNSALSGSNITRISDVTNVDGEVRFNLYRVATQGITNIQNINNLFLNDTRITEFHDLGNKLIGSDMYSNYVFQGATNLTRITLNALTELGTQCFNFTKIQMLDLPNLKKVRGGTFMNMTSLVIANLPNLEDNNEGATNLFYGCSSLVDVNAPKLNRLVTYSFGLCSNLSKAIFNEVIFVGSRAFHLCTSINEIQIRKSKNFNNNNTILNNIFSGIKNNCIIEVNIFHETSGLNGEVAPDLMQPYRENRAIIKFYDDNNNYIKNLSFTANTFIEGDFENDINNINDLYNLFSNNTNKDLTDFGIINNGFKFKNWSNITMTNLFRNDERIEKFLDNDGILEGALNSNSACFLNTTNLQELYLPNFKYAGNSFLQGSGLSIIDLPELLWFGNSSFEGMFNLTYANIPKVVEPNNTVYQFANCPNLTEVNAPLIKWLGAGFYQGCTSLIRAIHPNAISISNRAFYDCNSIEEIDLRSCKTIGSDGASLTNSFINIKMNCLIHIDISLKTSNSGQPHPDLLYVKNSRNATVKFYQNGVYVSDL